MQPDNTTDNTSGAVDATLSLIEKYRTQATRARDNAGPASRSIIAITPTELLAMIGESGSDREKLIAVNRENEFNKRELGAIDYLLSRRDALAKYAARTAKIEYAILIASSAARYERAAQNIITDLTELLKRAEADQHVNLLVELDGLVRRMAASYPEAESMATEIATLKRQVDDLSEKLAYSEGQEEILSDQAQQGRAYVEQLQDELRGITASDGIQRKLNEQLTAKLARIRALIENSVEARQEKTGVELAIVGDKVAEFISQLNKTLS